MSTPKHLIQKGGGRGCQSVWSGRMIVIPASRQGDTGRPGDYVDVLLNHAGSIIRDAKNVNFAAVVKGRKAHTADLHPPRMLRHLRMACVVKLHRNARSRGERQIWAGWDLRGSGGERSVVVVSTDRLDGNLIPGQEDVAFGNIMDWRSCNILEIGGTTALTAPSQVPHVDVAPGPESRKRWDNYPEKPNETMGHLCVPLFLKYLIGVIF